MSNSKNSSGKLTKTMQAALASIYEGVGHGVGSKGLTRNTANALARRGLVVLGYMDQPSFERKIRWAMLAGSEVAAYVAPYFTSDAEMSAAWAQFAVENAKHQAEQVTRVVERARASRVAAGKVTDAAWEITARELVAEHGWLKIDRAMDAKGVAK